MSRTARRAGSNTTRADKRRQTVRAQRERKALRRKRADMHNAMTQAARMVRSKRKGTRDFEQNMRTLGYEPRTDYHSGIGRAASGDVLNKYEATR